MQNFLALGAPPPDPRASGGWGLCPQTPSLQQLGASPPAAGGFAPRPPLASGGWGLSPQTPQTAPPLRISGYAPGQDTCEILISAAELMFLCMYALGVHSSFCCWLILYCSFIF